MIALDSLEQRFLAQVRGGESFPVDWCAPGIVDSAVGLAIYANAYRARLGDALLGDHPALSTYLGDELWSQTCRGYIDAYPSRVRSLRRFGTSLPDWLGAHPPFSEHPVLSELARWERILLDVFDAADAARVDWSVMQALETTSWPGLHLQFHPSLRRYRAERNTVAIWRALKDGGEPPDVTVTGPTAWLLWRDDDRITRFRPVDAVEELALDICGSDAGAFSILCERLSQDRPAAEVPALAIALLRRWFDEGLICAVAAARGDPAAQRGAA